ncbi:sulfotransferase family 2 domain-containing protein [Thalassotalea crassostreae]|uniref:sulfotransferase family 2 domain-containing protein n=1 Tax=Thalassotalea crassostreae TaxID=1763536 RepID=UPI0009EF0EE3|nr:sulfotransferase family 2 domain-containing protein [Thalassotalea crassostreae]
MLDDSYYKILVVREPYSRLVSAFVDKFCTEEIKQKWVQHVIKSVRQEDGCEQPSITFRQFVDYLSTVEVSQLNRHWRPQSHTVQGIDLDIVIDLKYLAQGLKYLESKFNFDSSIDNTQRRQHHQYVNVDESTDWSDTKNIDIMQYKNKNGYFPDKELFYDDEIRKKVKLFYAEDFKLCEKAAQTFSV